MTVRVFVGVAPDGCDAESQVVLEHSLRSRCSLPVEITWMQATHDPESLWHGWDMSSWATPFSGFRWGVPNAARWEGRAIYMDSDTIVLGDIAELWRLSLDRGQCVAARDNSKFCISLWDCARAAKHILPESQLRRRDGHAKQGLYFRSRPWLVRSFGPKWNYLDDVDDGPFTKVVHYTDLRAQPSFRYALPRLAAAGKQHWYDGPVQDGRPDVRELFEREFAAAQAAGYTVDRYIPEESFGPIFKRSMVGYRARG